MLRFHLHGLCTPAAPWHLHSITPIYNIYERSFEKHETYNDKIRRRTRHVLADSSYKLDATGVTVDLALNKEVGFGTDGGLEGEKAKGSGQEDNSLKRPCHCCCMCWDGELMQRWLVSRTKREGVFFIRAVGRLLVHLFLAVMFCEVIISLPFSWLQILIWPVLFFPALFHN